MNQGEWCHVFPEGKVWQNWRFPPGTPQLGELKMGVGKLIAHSRIQPTIIPIYHRGTDSIIPEKIPKEDGKAKRRHRPQPPKSLWPCIGKKVRMYVGQPFSLEAKVEEFKKKYPGMLDNWRSTPESIALYAELTRDVEVEMLKLEAEANAPTK